MLIANPPLAVGCRRPKPTSCTGYVLSHLRFDGQSSQLALPSLSSRGKLRSMTADLPEKIRSGPIVIFREPFPDELDKDGNQIPMRVLEVNGDRARLEAIVDMHIRPQSVHLVKELKLVE